jgi:hypothetical protein
MLAALNGISFRENVTKNEGLETPMVRKYINNLK